MSALSSWSSPVWIFGCCLFLCPAAGLVGGEVVLQRVAVTNDSAAAVPENVRFCRVTHVETVSQDPIKRPETSSKSDNHDLGDANALPDGSIVGYVVSNDSTTLLASLSKIEIIDGIGFRNSGAQGTVQIAIANAKLPADSPQWHQLMQQDLIPGAIKIQIGPNEAKYVKLTFNVIKTGRIADLGVYSIPLSVDFTMPPSRQIGKSQGSAVSGYNFSELCSRAQVIYVSSAEDLKLASNMIDEVPGTSFSFAANDTRPTVIIDLGEAKTLARISSIYSPAKGPVYFYVLKTLPGEAMPNGQDGVNTLHISETALTELKPIGSTVDDGTGRAAIDFTATTGRYVMLKWDLATQQHSAFHVANIAAFASNATQSKTLTVANVNLTDADARAISDGNDVTMDVKDFKECCNEPESPTEGLPPSLPEPPSSFISIPFVSP